MLYIRTLDDVIIAHTIYYDPLFHIHSISRITCERFSLVSNHNMALRETNLIANKSKYGLESCIYLNLGNRRLELGKYLVNELFTGY